MTRRALFLLSPQVMRLLPSGDMEKLKPANNQCPVCGEFNPPYIGPEQRRNWISCQFCTGVFAQKEQPK